MGSCARPPLLVLGDCCMQGINVIEITIHDVVLDPRLNRFLRNRDRKRVVMNIIIVTTDTGVALGYYPDLL